MLNRCLDSISNNVLSSILLYTQLIKFSFCNAAIPSEYGSDNDEHEFEIFSEGMSAISSALNEDY